MFYLWSALLLGLGAVFVAWALLRSIRAGASTISRQQTVTALYRDRLEELCGEVSDSQIDSVDRSDLEEELGAALLRDYSEEEAEAQHRLSRNPGLAAVSAVLLVVGVLLVYQLVGYPQSIQLAGAEQVLQMDPARDSESLASWRQQLSQRVDRDSSDAKSWYLLGHVDLKLGRFPSAAEAFAMAHDEHGDDPSIDVFWLQSRYLAARGQIDKTSRVIADRILARNPGQPMVLEMYAIDAFQRGEFQESVGLLNRALSGELDPTHRATLAAGYQEARLRLGDLPVAVDLAISADSEVPRGATLFVIARPVGGGMPFAVVKRPAEGLPRTIRLDDAVSMNPAAPLSAAATVELVVRISRSGTAMAHPGDWEWHSGSISLLEQAEPLAFTAALAAPAE